MTLDEYLAQAAGQRWMWGETDCTMFACGWVLERTGRDPAERVRGYRTKEEAAGLITRAGGLLSLIAPEMDRLGFRRTDEPETGDVGLVLAPGGMSPDGTDPAVAAIRSGPWWIARSPRGVSGAEFETLAAWRI